MTLISFFKKYFCCDTNKKVQINLKNDNLELQKTFEKSNFHDLKNCKDLAHYHGGFDNCVRLLCPLSAFEVFENYDIDNEKDCHFFDLTYYKIKHLPVSTINKPTLVLDLDNTLILSTTKELSTFDHKISINYNGKAQTVWILERPGLQSFLDYVSNKFELVLFTAGILQYGAKIMRKIDKKRRIHYFLDRRFCRLIENETKSQDFFSKDLQVLGRDLSNVLLVDDREYSFHFNRSNGILVPVFDGDLKDNCLDCLKKYLDYCYTLKDMRDRKPFVFNNKSL